MVGGIPGVSLMGLVDYTGYHNPNEEGPMIRVRIQIKIRITIKNAILVRLV
jgi:hypothetical protein